jgi:hypothetical protein
MVELKFTLKELEALSYLVTESIKETGMTDDEDDLVILHKKIQNGINEYQSPVKEKIQYLFSRIYELENKVDRLEEDYYLHCRNHG